MWVHNIFITLTKDVNWYVTYDDFRFIAYQVIVQLTNIFQICRYKNVFDLTNQTAGIYKKDGGNYEFLGKTNGSLFTPDGRSIYYFNGPS